MNYPFLSTQVIIKKPEIFLKTCLCEVYQVIEINWHSTISFSEPTSNRKVYPEIMHTTGFPKY